MDSLQGQLLIASSQLRDANFVRTVILLIQADQKGAWGVVVNRPTGKTIQELWEEMGETSHDNPLPVHLGGPVPGPVVALHGEESLSELEIVPGVHFSAGKESLRRLVNHPPDPFKLFVGNAGWGPGQLEGELKQGAWLTAPASADAVFYDGDDFWGRATRSVGESVLRSALKLKDMPEDPSMN